MERKQRAVGGEYRTCRAETKVGVEPEYALEEEGLGVGSDCGSLRHEAMTSTPVALRGARSTTSKSGDPLCEGVAHVAPHRRQGAVG